MSNFWAKVFHKIYNGINALCELKWHFSSHTTIKVGQTRKFFIFLVCYRTSSTNNSHFCSHKLLIKFSVLCDIFLVCYWICSTKGPFLFDIIQKFKLIYKSNEASVNSKIQQTKMLVTCQRFDEFFLFGLVWQYSSVQTKYNKGRFKVGLLTCSSNITLRLPSYTGSALKR